MKALTVIKYSTLRLLLQKEDWKLDTLFDLYDSKQHLSCRFAYANSVHPTGLTMFVPIATL